MASSADRRTLFRGPHGQVSAGICLLVSLYAFEEMGVAAALPTAVKDLEGLAHFGWAYTGFLAASVVGMSGAGHLSDRYGPRRPILLSVALFVAGLVVAGTATDMTSLIGGRVVQGLSGGGLVSSVYIVVGTLVPKELRPRLFAAIAFCWVAPGIAGPTLSGVVTEHISWRWVFLGLVPLAVLAAALLVPALSTAQRTTRHRSGAPDAAERRPAHTVSPIAAALGIAAIQAGAQRRPSPQSLVAIAIGASALVWAIRRLLPAGTALARTAVGAPVAMRGINAAALFGVEAMIPLMMTTQHGLGPLESSIPLACAGLPCFLSAWWIGRLPAAGALDRRIRLAHLGFGLLAVADGSFVWLCRPDSPSWLMGVMWSLAGFGIGLVVPTANVLVLERTNDGAADAAALPIADTIGSCLATGFSGVLVAFASRGTWTFTTAFSVIGIAMTGVCLLGVAVVGRLRLSPLRLDAEVPG